jgi:hypothetical protein
MEKIFAEVFAPVINFLKEQGLWDGLVSVWNRIASFADTLLTGSGGSIFGGNSESGGSFLTNLIKLIVAIFVTLINVIMDIISWVLGVFK